MALYKFRIINIVMLEKVSQKSSVDKNNEV